MRFVFVLLMIPFMASAQKTASRNYSRHPSDLLLSRSYHVGQTVPQDTTLIKPLLFSIIDNLKDQRSQLVLESVVVSPHARHYRFAQTLNHRKIFRGSMKISISNNGRVLSLFDHTFSVEGTADPIFPDHAAYIEGLTKHYKRSEPGKLDHFKLEEVYYAETDEMLPCIRLEVVERTDRYYEMVLNKDVHVIYQNDLLSYSQPQDSTATLWVFNPDPLTSSGQNYGSPYVDSFDQDVAELNAERVPRQMTLTFENDTFFLRNDYASVIEFSLPNTAPTFSLTPTFNYVRSESGFEDVNAYYHINNFQQYLRSLGFTNLVDYPIGIDAHALNGSDNSNFNPGYSPPRLSYGEGGVDDAEDADVIIHEYGHAIMNSAAPGTNIGSERQALDEAIGDYFASSYSRSISSFRWSDVFTWDGHNEFWNGRSSVSTKHYPEDISFNIYSDAPIWSATLMQIWSDIGREATDAIMLQAAYSFADGMSMTDAAMLFLQADTLLYGGSHFTPIRQRMFDRGLIPWNVGIQENSPSDLGISIRNTAGFASGTGPLNVSANDSFVLRLYDLTGKLLTIELDDNGVVLLSGQNLANGMYIADISVEGRHYSFKLIRL